jgi:hypothetical protein
LFHSFQEALVLTKKTVFEKESFHLASRQAQAGAIAPAAVEWRFIQQPTILRKIHGNLPIR